MSPAAMWLQPHCRMLEDIVHLSLTDSQETLQECEHLLCESGSQVNLRQRCYTAAIDTQM